MELIARAQAAPWHSAIQLFFGDRETATKVTSITFQQVEPGAIPEPSMTLTVDAAQLLMDDLWMAGLRPTEGSGSAGSLKATEKHLEDMRALVFRNGIINSKE